MSSTEKFLLVADDGQKLGLFTLSEAQALSSNQNLDLIKVGDNPIVYKMLDKGKLEYYKKKNRKRGKSQNIKDMRFSMRIDPHDMQTKINHVRRFLEHGDIVRIYVLMQGREKSRPDLAVDKIHQIISGINMHVSFSKPTVSVASDGLSSKISHVSSTVRC